MSTLFAIALTAHILLGLIALFLHFGTLLALLKKTVSQTFVVRTATVAALLYVLSWVAGGYYYVFHYGSQVKPAIVEGMYAWAHIIVMEWKEHAFLILPPAAVVLALALRYAPISEDDTKLRSAYIFLAATLVVLATAITLSGIIISGGAR